VKVDTLEPKGLRQATNPLWGQSPFRRIDVARYISPEHVTLERDRLWPNVWQMACREEEIPNHGDYFEFQILDQSVLIVRLSSGKIKAYFNSCLHRGTQLAKGCGNMTQFTCPFHGWRWSLEGENRYVHDRAEFPGLKDEDLRLSECRVGSWGGFVFVKLTDGGPSLDEFLAPMAALVGPYRLEEYRINFWRSAVLGANWKTALEAFEESYHHMGTHPQVLSGCCEVTGIYENFGAHSRMIIPTGIPSGHYGDRVSEHEVLEAAIENLVAVNLVNKEQRKVVEEILSRPLPEGMTTRKICQSLTQDVLSRFLPDVPTDQYLDAWNCTIFPNYVINLLPANIFSFHTRPNGSDPDSCIFDVISLQHPCGASVERVGREKITDPNFDWGTVLNQDWANMPRVQQGMHQRTTKRTRLASYQEKRIVNRFTHIDKYFEQFKD
jgi:phenylpropionate dioxygenase-like ring-hydroxylating dioxygenase large terminal subunit